MAKVNGMRHVIVDTAYRVDENSLKGNFLPNIPVHPIGYGMAKRLLG